MTFWTVSKLCLTLGVLLWTNFSLIAVNYRLPCRAVPPRWRVACIIMTCVGAHARVIPFTSSHAVCRAPDAINRFVVLSCLPLELRVVPICRFLDRDIGDVDRHTSNRAVRFTIIFDSFHLSNRFKSIHHYAKFGISIWCILYRCIIVCTLLLHSCCHWRLCFTYSLIVELSCFCLQSS